MRAPSFNARMEPATIGGHPLAAVIGAVTAVLFVPLAILLPWWPVKIILVVIAAAAAVIAIYFVRLGEDAPFQGVMFAARREKSLLTHDFQGDA